MTLEQQLAQYAFFSQPSTQTQGVGGLPQLQQNTQLPPVSGSQTQTSVGIDINTVRSHLNTYLHVRSVSQIIQGSKWFNLI